MSTSSTMGLRDLYDQASELAPGERAEWLLHNCPDPALRAQVWRLLEVTGIDPLAQSARDRIAALEAPPAPVREIGGFRLIRPIGKGGMATVWLAERTGFAQRVAIKLLHRSLIGELERQLYERERRVLASLEHPGIARLIDGGIDSQQQPWLAMEYVEGENLLDYARNRQLSPRDRIALLYDVCEAVAAAHAQLVVHRDLKPGNVLVGPDGRIKLLDFGIAKVLADGPDLTAQGHAAFTPAYAAPEQLQGQSTGTATDVYALGLMAIELLLGFRPTDPHRLPPSHLLLAADADQATRRSLARFLRGDLDNVLRKAVDEDPRRRYPGAQALADDLRRFLAHQPVAAHPPSRWYLVSKFARRHRGGVVVSAVLSIATLLSLALALWWGAQAREQAQLARAESTRAEAALRVSERAEAFILDLFGATLRPSDGAEAPSGRNLLVHAEGQIESQFAQAPEVAVRLLGQLAVVHELAAAPQDAQRLRAAARRLAERRLAPTAEARRAAVFADAADRSRAGEPAAFDDMRGVVVAETGDPSAAAVGRRRSLAMRLLAAGQVDEGATLLTSALVGLRELCDAGQGIQCELLLSTLQIAPAILAEHRPEQARALATQAVAETRRQLGADDPRAVGAQRLLDLLNEPGSHCVGGQGCRLASAGRQADPATGPVRKDSPYGRRDGLAANDDPSAPQHR